MLSIPAMESMMWLGAGKIHDFHPIILYPASHIPGIISQMTRRFRLPEIVGLPAFRGRGVRYDSVDTIDFFLDLGSDQMNQFGNLLAVKISRMRQRNVNLPAHPAGMRVQHDDPVGQTNRFANRMRDEQDRLMR